MTPTIWHPELIFIFILGLAIGSFLNVVIDRLPHGRQIGGRSQCDHCKRVLMPIELIPVISFALQKARSVCCQKRLSIQYPLVEVVTAAVFVWVWRAFGLADPISGSLYLIIASALIVIIGTDVKERIIPDYMTLIISLTGGLLGFMRGGWAQVGSHIVAGLVLFGIMFAIWALTKGKGMGFGDVKFAFAMGILLGMQAGLAALYGAFIIGGIVSLILLLFAGKGMKSKIAFGPFLVIGTVLGPDILLLAQRLL